MSDTSRLARSQFIAHSLIDEYGKRNIKVIFAKTHELDGINAILLPATLHAIDKVHFRAGGRAPYGYKLEYTPTGAIREGEAVTKSKLVLDEANASKIAAYLKGRAQGLTGTNLAEKLGIVLARTSLYGIEWNALTYSGHTVWNVHNEKSDEGGYKSSVKRRPRSEWLIHRDTHPALITETEAEQILQKLELGRIKTNRTRSKHLLTGILTSPDGNGLHGDGQYYRLGTKSVKAARIDGAIIQQLTNDLQSDEFVKALVKSAHKTSQDTNDGKELKDAQSEMRVIDAKIEKLSNLLIETTATATLLRKIESLEQERSDILFSIEAAESAIAQAKVMQKIEEKDVRAILSNFAVSIVEDDRDDLKEILRGLIDSIVFDYSTLDCCIHYKIPVKSRDLVACQRR